MVTISSKEIKTVFNKKIVPFITCLGIDVASRTGWCLATTTPEEIKLTYGFVDINSTDKYFKYNRYIEIFKSMPIADKIIIEESFYGKNVKTFQMLSRLGGVIYAALVIHGQKDIQFL
jgi:Holliday junction resolvasome RuvABC endonuclease subunit